jgi:sugar-specific transcriptional regulator TrmB
MYEGIFKEIGFTKSETLVYLALLDLGGSTIGLIIKESGIASGKAYLVLGSLVKKGIVTYVIKSGVKHYRPKSPDRLLDYLNEKKREFNEKEKNLKEIIPQLKAKFKDNKEPTSAELFEGSKGFKTYHEWTLKKLNKGDTVYVMSAPKEANEKFGAYLFDWNKRRVKKGVKLKILYNHDSKKFGKLREKLKLTEVRYMTQKLETPAWVDIFQDYVININVESTPVCFLMKNKASAESYKKYFEIMWKQAKK